MARVMIDDWAWDLICDHYARLSDPTPDDRRVMQYMADKISRQIAREAYASERRIDRLGTNRNTGLDCQNTTV